MTSTALVPIGMYDTQVLNMITQLSKPAPETDTNYIKSIKATLKGISVEGAISVLYTLGYENDEFRDKEGKWIIHEIGLEKYFPDCVGRRADETHKIVFWGGPPNNLNWFFGTFYTLLEDRVLFEIRVKGAEEIAKYIGTDLNTVC